jgi:endoglucanase
VDNVCSYASNEIAINWQAPIVYLTHALEALKQEVGYTQTLSKKK